MQKLQLLGTLTLYAHLSAIALKRFKVSLPMEKVNMQMTENFEKCVQNRTENGFVN